MTPEQKQQAQQAIEWWQSVRNDDPIKPAGAVLAAVLQELINAPEPEPVLVVETEPGYWNRGHYCEGTKSYIDPTKVGGLPVGTKLYTAPPAPSVPETEPVAWNVEGKDGETMCVTDNKFAADRYIACGYVVEPLYTAPPHQSEHHLEMVNTPAPSVTGEELQAAFARGLKAGNEQKDAQQVEIHRLHGLLAAAPTSADIDGPEFSDGCEKEGFPGGCERMGCCKPTPAEATSVPDSVASEPVGYLYTNLQSGEYHVSDADDDYRGPERVLWCIEPVYRRAKGKQA